jgi:hypothetical protein
MTWAFAFLGIYTFFDNQTHWAALWFFLAWVTA